MRKSQNFKKGIMKLCDTENKRVLAGRPKVKPESCIKEITGEIKLDFAEELREFQGDLKDFGKKQNDFLSELRQEKCERQQ